MTTPGTTDNVAAATEITALWSVDGASKGVSVFNDSGASNLYIGYTDEVSTTVFVVKVPPGGYWEMPFTEPRSDIIAGWGIWDGSPLESDAANVTAY